MASSRQAVVLSILIGIISYVAVLWRSYPARAPPEVDLGYVHYTGVYKRTEGLNAFYGIRYGQAPAGNMRWRKPVAIDQKKVATKERLDATQRGPKCPGGSMPLEIAFITVPPRFDEDCLSLDVVAPAVPVSNSLPVIVHIHGGGYGTGGTDEFPGDQLVKHSKGNLIHVTMTYRLGLYGFLAGDDVKADGSWNVGLLDQRLALEWVQRHISKFGGDPSRVTIAGASAGGGSVTMQMMLYGGEEKPPFRAAIAEYPWWTPPYSDAGLNKQYRRVLKTAGCKSLQCLRDLSIAELDKVAIQSFKEARKERELASGLFYWGPSIDGTILQGNPIKEFASGHFTKVPLLIDHNEFEGIIFTNMSIKTESDVLDDLNVAWQDKSRKQLGQLLQLYPAANYGGLLLKDVTLVKIMSMLHKVSTIIQTVTGKSVLADAVMQRQSFFGDAIVNCPTNYIANAVSASGQRVYKMIFKAGLQVHGATVAFLYNENISPAGYPTGKQVMPLFINSTIGATMLDTFVSFAIHQNPNVFTTRSNLVEWPVFQPGTEQILEISNKDIRAIADPDSSEKCQALKALAE